MSVGGRHSLWIVPSRDSAVFERLANLIADIAERFASPRFDPHVTLWGNLAGPADELARAGAGLGTSIPPLEITLGRLGSCHTYFRQLFAEAALTAELAQAHRQAAAHLRLPSEAYAPHLSLYYGDAAGEDVMRRAEARIQAAAVVGTRFPAARLELWRTDGPVETWSSVAGVPLGRASHAS